MASNSTCPSDLNLVYSPFKPFSQSVYFACTNRTDNACWWWIIVLLSSADEARKKQFDATSLVMGLIPLTLKGVAWLERRLVRVSRQLPKYVEVVIRALGVVPSIEAPSSPDQQAAVPTGLYKLANNLSYPGSLLFVGISVLGLVLTYAALAVIETYSKRSSLGCIYPIFVLTWHLVAIIPAGLETVLPRASKNKNMFEVFPRSTSEPSTSILDSDHVELVEQYEQTLSNAAIHQPPGHLDSATHSSEVRTTGGIQDPDPASDRRLGLGPAVASSNAYSGHFPPEDASPVQGRGKAWLVQLLWAVYYIAGTLVYTSIVAVTVIELVVWVGASIAVTSASKFLGFFLCVAIERKRRGGLPHRR